MARADFYILPQPDEPSRFTFICRICEKALEQGLKVYIYTRDPAQAEYLDRFMWAYREDSFLPHHRIGQTPSAPISIGWGEQVPDHRSLFINAADQLIELAFEFDRIAEIVIQDQRLLDTSRQNYVRCRDLGYELNRVDMRSRQG